MAAKKSTSAMDFILESLKGNRDAEYGEIAAAAKKKNLTIWPIMFGRAQALLGIVKQAPRGQGKMAKARAAKAAKPASVATTDIARRGPGRPRKNPVATGSLEGIVAVIQSGEREKARYQTALQRIQGILSSLS